MKTLIAIFFLTLTIGCGTASMRVSNTPSPRVQEYPWMSIQQWQTSHKEDVAIAEKGEARLVFLGDSITQGWNHELWQRHFAPHNAANFGIGGDKTQNVLWRLQNGGAGNLKPKLIVLMIGVNNFGHENASKEDVVLGVNAILDETDKQFPKAKTLLLGILPYGESSEVVNRERVTATNTALKSLSKKRGLIYRDYGNLFLDEQGNIPRDLMGDLLHPSKAGYQIIANELAPLVNQLMGSNTVSSFTADNIRIEGRHSVKDDNSVQIGYPGVSTHLNFHGKQLSLTASSSNGKNLLDIYIDEELHKTLNIEKQPRAYELLNSKHKQKHRIELVHRSETWHGTLNLASLNLHDGKLLKPPTLPSRKLLFIGDSITCGEALLRESVCKKEFTWWDPEHAYGKLLGETFDAQAHLVCYGGRGLIRSWNGKTDELNAPDFFHLAVVDDTSSLQWDHKQYHPDLVFVALGTNDFSLGIGPLPEEEEYVSAYVKFISDIQAQHPQATIALTEGPMVNDTADPNRPQKSVLKRYIQKVKAQSKGKVDIVHSSQHPGDSCDAHPTAKQHAAMAKEYAPQIQKIMGW